MQQFTKESNGYTLVIEIDKDELIRKLELDIAEMEQIKQEHGENIDEEIKWEYDMCQVYGDCEDDFCTPDEIIANRNEFIAIVERLANSDGAELWNMVQLKKNGTFKKNSKPMLKEAINGSYWEDSYGWNTLVMRLEPVTDTLARVKLDHIVLHY